jgi:hypothetical protein
LVIPACPLALDASRRWNPRRQRALVRYYFDAGAGGIAIAVHTTQFAIRDAKHDLFRPVLELIADEMAGRQQERPVARIAGICGASAQALDEARFAQDHGYHAGLLNLAALASATEEELIAHCRRVADVLPIFGFYLFSAVGGRPLPLSFWRKFVEIDKVVAIKIAPFNRYQTLDVVRAVIEAGRDDIALYTGNDDNIVADLLTPFAFNRNGRRHERRIVGGLLAQWAVGTRAAVELLEECHRVAETGGAIPVELLRRNMEVTDANAAIFDAANHFVGCVPGVHEVLRRQGLLEGTWCLNPDETLSEGQAAEIDRVCRAYPNMFDDPFVAQNLDRWLANH